jgi:transcriptional regulator with XRE-family HTH domain
MPKGVPYRVQVPGKVTRSYTFTEIAAGTGLSLALVSLVLRGKRPVSEYAQPRLAKFFGITIEQLRTPGTIVVATPPARPLGRVVGRIRPHSSYRLPVRNTDPVSQFLEALEHELCRPCPRGQLEDSDKLPQESEPFPAANVRRF